MKNLDRTATATIDTGNGNDVLNIDGFVSVYGGKLHGKLGPGFNTLSFLLIRKTPRSVELSTIHLTTIWLFSSEKVEERILLVMWDQ